MIHRKAEAGGQRWSESSCLWITVNGCKQNHPALFQSQHFFSPLPSPTTPMALNVCALTLHPVTPVMLCHFLQVWSCCGAQEKMQCLPDTRDHASCCPCARTVVVSQFFLPFVFTSLLKVLQAKLSPGSHCHLWYLAMGQLSLQTASGLC